MSTITFAPQVSTVRRTTTARPVCARSQHSQVRLTRRGRLVVVLSLLALLVVGLASTGQSSQASGRVAATRPVTVTVQTGETLWQLATRVAPHTDPRLVVDEIERLNRLSGSTVYAGQQLRVPQYR
jgi:LysM repeat protein